MHNQVDRNEKVHLFFQQVIGENAADALFEVNGVTFNSAQSSSLCKQQHFVHISITGCDLQDSIIFFDS